MVALLEVEDRAWPFVVSVIPPDPNVDFFKAYFAKQMELLDRKQRWVHVVDVRQVIKLPDAKVRLVVAEHTKPIEQLSAKYNAGTATIIRSSLVRGMLTAIQWISPPPHPFSNVGTPREAVDFLRGCLQNESIPVPARMTPEFVEMAVARACQPVTAKTANSR